jgi:hypothetical protein
MIPPFASGLDQAVSSELPAAAVPLISGAVEREPAARTPRNLREAGGHSTEAAWSNKTCTSRLRRVFSCSLQDSETQCFDLVSNDGARAGTSPFLAGTHVLSAARRRPGSLQILVESGRCWFRENPLQPHGSQFGTTSVVNAMRRRAV